MFKTYQDIFKQRGSTYHQAMHKYPQARAEEFLAIISLAQIEPQQTVIDVPSGGGYLANFLPVETNLIAVETCSRFAKASEQVKKLSSLLCNSLAQIPIASNSAERIISLAGLHHMEDLSSVWSEFYRLLAVGGILCVADVRANSPVARFLNIFVAHYNSVGHQGCFFDSQTPIGLMNAGFNLRHYLSLNYHWRFDSLSEMIDYCQLLFGLDLASPQEILMGIREYLGYEIIAGQYCLNWELMFYQCSK